MSGLKIILPAPCAFILSRLHENGFEAYAVGGCVRDSLLHKTPHDWDITTAAKPEKIIELFSDIPVLETGLKHGTVTLLTDHEPYEVTTFRVDGDYTDGRHPDSVAFTTDIRDDLARRDLTINAMAYSPATGIIDPFGGQEDLKNEIIRCVGDPHKRFSEDALRLMRTIRFAAVLGFTVEPETLRAVHDLHETIGRVAKERIFTELLKTVCAPYAVEALRAAPELFFCAVPQLKNLQDVPQNSKYHMYDVWEHTLHALESIGTDDPIACLAILFHDVGKKAVRTTGEDGYDHFFGHAEKSAAFTDEALRALHCDNKTRENVAELVLLHDTAFPKRTAKFRRLLAKLGYEQFYRLLTVSRADSLAHAPWCIEDRCKALADAKSEAEALQEADFCLSLRQLKITGKDLQAFGFQGKAIGETLNKLLDAVLCGQLSNDREVLLLHLERYTQKHK